MGGGLTVTGLGIVSPLGVGRADFARALAGGRVGMGELTLCEVPESSACEHAAEVRDYDWTRHLRTKQAYADRVTQLALGAARLALSDAALPPPIETAGDTARTGICFGSLFACIETQEKFFAPVAAGTPKRAGALFFSHAAPNAPAAFCAVELGLGGFSTVYSGDAAAGSQALASAARAVERGTSERVLAGAGEAITAMSFSHGAFPHPLPNTRGRTPPTRVADAADDAEKNLWGQAPGEGAVFAVLERSDGADARGARVLGRWADADSLMAAFDAAARTFDVGWIFGRSGAVGTWFRALGGGFLRLDPDW